MMQQHHDLLQDISLFCFCTTISGYIKLIICFIEPPKATESTQSDLELLHIFFRFSTDEEQDVCEPVGRRKKKLTAAPSSSASCFRLNQHVWKKQHGWMGHISSSTVFELFNMELRGWMIFLIRRTRGQRGRTGTTRRMLFKGQST